MHKLRTFLWFDDTAEEAARFYVSIFKNSQAMLKMVKIDVAALQRAYDGP